MIGGVVALIVEMVVLPVKARTRLVESISAVLRQISEMENVIAIGIEEGRNLEGIPNYRIVEFEHASGKANSALTAAETFCETKCDPQCGPFSPCSWLQYHSVLTNRGSRVHLKPSL
jgi:hypothetical protein